MLGRLLVISKDFDITKSPNYVKELCFYLANDGVETHVVCYGNEDNDYSLTDNFFVHQVKFILGTNNTYNWHMMMSNELKRRSRELMEEKPFDLVHAFDWSAYPAAYGVSKMFEKPFVMTLNSTEKERGWGIHESGMISEIEWLSTYDSSHIIVLNDNTRNILIHDYHIPQEKISMIQGTDPYAETKSIYEKIANN